jgi:glycine cleavage system H protein
MNYPENFKYTKDHEWVEINGNQISLGITDYAQDSLGDIVMVELPEVGAEFNQGDTIGVVESVKSVSDIFTPVSGKIIEINQDLDQTPEILNEDPNAKGWICKIELTNSDELSELMDVNQYQELINSL